MSATPSRPRPARFGARVGGLAVAAVLVLAGCGGDSGDGDAGAPTTTASPPPTATTSAALPHGQLVERADAACMKAADAVTAIAPARSLSALADYAAEARGIGDDLHEQLAALTPDAGDRAAYAAYLDGLQASNAALDAMGTAARDGDAAGVRAAAKEIDQIAVGVLATRAGLASCAATVADGAGS